MKVCDVLVTIFIVLKLTKLINWSWIWVLSPLWILFLILLSIYFIIDCYFYFLKKVTLRNINRIERELK